MDMLPPIYAAFKPADQSIVMAAMQEPEPISGGRVPEEQLRSYPLVEFLKDNMNMNHIGVPGIDPR